MKPLLVERYIAFTRPLGLNPYTPTPTATPIERVVIGISWLVYLLIAYILIHASIKFLLPSIARYFGYLVKEFNKERNKK